MEEVLKMAIALIYLKDQNVKDTSTLHYIEILEKELEAKTKDIALQYLGDRFGPN